MDKCNGTGKPPAGQAELGVIATCDQCGKTLGLMLLREGPSPVMACQACRTMYPLAEVLLFLRKFLAARVRKG